MKIERVELLRVVTDAAEGWSEFVGAAELVLYAND